MEEEFINLTAENIETEHLCCIIRTKTVHEGIEAKRKWLCDRLPEGHVLRKLNAKGTAFIEYAPLETAWVPILGDNYLYVYCLWVAGEFKGRGIGRKLLEYCLADAKARGKAGVCMLGADKQKAWLTDQAFAKKFGFKVIDTTDCGYTLLALPFGKDLPRFSGSARTGTIAERALTIFYDDQCPFIPQYLESISAYCKEKAIPLRLVKVSSLEQAKSLPCAFNNWAVFYNGKFQTVNLLPSPAQIDSIIRRR